jgi:hypothetical protein
MKDKFSDMLKFGISLKLSGPDEDKYYAQRLRFFIMELEDLDATSEDDEVIDIWLMNELSLKVVIKESTLTFDPVTETSYDCIMAVLQFISLCHDEVQKDYLRDEEVISSELPIMVEEEPEEESDDFEWI